jgi:hypothetical protein
LPKGNLILLVLCEGLLLCREDGGELSFHSRVAGASIHPELGTGRLGRWEDHRDGLGFGKRRRRVRGERWKWRDGASERRFRTNAERGRRGRRQRQDGRGYYQALLIRTGDLTATTPPEWGQWGRHGKLVEIEMDGLRLGPVSQFLPRDLM